MFPFFLYVLQSCFYIVISTDNNDKKIEFKWQIFFSCFAVYGFDKIKAALLIYKSLYGNLLVSDMFIVPKNTEEWDRDLWGMKLG